MDGHRKCILGILLLTFVTAGCAQHATGMAAHAPPAKHTTTVDPERRDLASYRTHSTHTKYEQGRKHREAVKAAKRLTHACRDLPGGQIITGSTVGECDHNRAATLTKLRNEQAWANDHAQRQPGDGIPGDDDTSQDPRIQAHPNGHAPGMSKREAWREYELRKKAAKKGTYGHKATHCPAGQHPVGETGACG